MTLEPRQREDYSDRQIEAAHRVLVDLGQVLKSFEDCLVVVGGWVPDLLMEKAEEAHVGSIDVDLALDAGKLADGRYAELLKVLLDTRRYQQADEPFKLYAEVDALSTRMKCSANKHAVERSELISIRGRANAEAGCNFRQLTSSPGGVGQQAK